MKQSILNWDEMIYEDCARGLFCPDEAEMLDMGPLPPEEHSAADYDALEVGEMLNGMAADLKTLFQQGETLNRFSPDYADLCPRMMELLKMAGCALSTLYVHGEDLNTAAVSILELRQLASFHFRKCQAAARVAAGKNEKVYVRTAGLELQWAKLLLRLKQTEIRFSRPLPQPKIVHSAVVHPSVKPLQLETAETPAAQPASTLSRVRAIPAAAPLRAQNPAPRASMLPAAMPQMKPYKNETVLPQPAEGAAPRTCKRSRDFHVTRETTLEDLFAAYGMEYHDPDSG